MGHSQRLSQAEIRRGFRLVGEVCEVGEAPVVWRTHLLLGVCRLVGAKSGFADEELVGPRPDESAVLGHANVGLDDAGKEGYARYQAEGGFNIHPLFPHIYPVAHLAWTRTRRQMVADGSWYASRVVSEYQRPGDIDDTIHSRQPIPRAGWSNLCAVFRGWGARPFSVRERRLVHLVHGEVGRLWRRPPPADPADRLPPRLRRVVRCLRAGDGEKQVAGRLGLAPQTIHSYVKELYRRVDVSARFDLLARLAPPRPTLRPRLSYEEKLDAAGGEGKKGHSSLIK